MIVRIPWGCERPTGPVGIILEGARHYKFFRE